MRSVFHEQKNPALLIQTLCTNAFTFVNMFINVSHPLYHMIRFKWINHFEFLFFFQNNWGGGAATANLVPTPSLTSQLGNWMCIHCKSTCLHHAHIFCFPFHQYSSTIFTLLLFSFVLSLSELQSRCHQENKGITITRRWGR